jgi:hypothetical protein
VNLDIEQEYPQTFMQERIAVDKAIKSFFGLGEGVTHGEEGKKYKEVKAKLAELGLMLCGGAITSIFSAMKINDLDFYMTNEEKLPEIKAFLIGYFEQPLFQTGNAITFKHKSSRSPKVWSIQLITRFTGTPRKIMDDFDFTVTQGVYKFDEEAFYFGERFLQDVSKRKLVYLGKSHYPICAMYRTKKYQAKGYSCPGSTIMHIALSIVRLEIKTYKQLKEQLMGIDTAYLQGLLGSEGYGDELPVNYGQFLVDAFSRFDGFDHEDDFENEAIEPNEVNV